MKLKILSWNSVANVGVEHPHRGGEVHYLPISIRVAMPTLQGSWR
jgi:hypothetical protein